MNGAAANLADLQAVPDSVRAAAALPWLAAARAAAAERLAVSGLPQPRSEAWKYLNLRPLLHRDLGLGDQPPAPAVVPAGAPLLPGPGEGLDRVLFDGDRVLLPATLPEGVLVHRFSDLGDQARARLLGLLDQPSAAGLPFADLNSLRLQDGVLLEVPDGIHVARPLALVARQGSAPAHRRLVVHLGANSSLGLVEDAQPVDGDSPGLVTQVADVHLAAGARLQHTRLHRDGAAAAVVDALRVQLGRDASWQLHQVSLGAALRRNDIHVDLAEGAEAQLQAAFLLAGSAQLDNHLCLEHRGRHSRSNSVLRGLADGRSRGVVNGRIHIHPGAPGVAADLASNNLLLSAEAEIDTKPELEIYTDDVRCSHGATVGQLDAGALFYLRSRGVPAAMARHLLAFGFLAAVLGEHPDAALAEGLRKVLAAAWDANDAEVGP